jgi:hypothetical protein
VTDGRIRYRGLEVTRLALWRPFEEVAAWLWTGGLDTGSAAQPWQATQEAVAAGTQAGPGARRRPGMRRSRSELELSAVRSGPPQEGKCRWPSAA